MTEHTPRNAPSNPGRRSRWGSIGWATAAIALVGLVTTVIVAGNMPSAAGPHTPPSVTDRLSSASATLIQLDDISSDKLRAPDFTLTDQHGRPMTLAQFAGRPVVLTFNDDKCADLCTLLAQDVAAANTDLGPARNRIAYVSINANPYFTDVASVKSWTDQHGLSTADNWYFGTATPTTLARLAQAFGVPIQPDPSTQSVVHGTEIFFINPHGIETAIGQFGTESADTGPFAHAMAQAADNLLPASKQTPVAGPSLPPPAHGGTDLGDTPAPFTLPLLGDPHHGTVSTLTSRGTYTVLNFWASTCTACVNEMPALEREHQTLGTKVVIDGIDVADQSTAANTFAHQNRISYPIGEDPNGRIAGHFHITGLPYTVILDPAGKVAIRHAGALTQEQLDYVLSTLDPSLHH